MASTASDYDVAYIGCYTRSRQADPFVDSHGGVPHDESQVGSGILAVRVYPTGTLSSPVLVDESVPNPSYLATLENFDVRNDDTYRYRPSLLLVASEVEEGKLHMFEIGSDDPMKLRPLACPYLTTNGSYPCHVKTLENHRDGFDSVFVSNYGNDNDGGSVTVYKRVGSTEPVIAQNIMHGIDGSQGSASRQMVSHAHSCVIGGETQDIFTADLGLDAIIRYGYRNGELVETGRLALPLGSGPRSLIFNPDPKKSHIGAVSLEVSAEVALVQLRKHDSCLELVGKPLGVLPSGWPDRDDSMVQYNGGKWVSDAAWSATGELLFVAARLHNSISVFRLDSACTHLVLVGRASTTGTTPRCIKVHGQVLLVAHQHSHDVTSFKIDEKSGTLTLVDKVLAPLAACVQFLSSK